ncbi:YbaB/EbfC family nucleoid-associated protein [Nocardia sp. NPDC052001]|uniref:YbaB/EbfC family nucleoid-associated protein n=1 Tax=Nocardia sp. NPDC052001 TaxID=3154853 RepID=UPI003436B541
MSSNAELAARAERIDAEISQVRGRAQTTDGSVVVETNPYGSITGLHFSSHVTSVEPSRLAAVIVELHRRAYEDAKASGAKVFQAIKDNGQARRVAERPSDEWEEVVPVRYTSSF